MTWDEFFSSPQFLQALALYEEQECERLDAELALENPTVILPEILGRTEKSKP